MKRSKPDRAHPVMVALVVILWAFIGIILLFMYASWRYVLALFGGS